MVEERQFKMQINKIISVSVKSIKKIIGWTECPGKVSLSGGQLAG